LVSIAPAEFGLPDAVLRVPTTPAGFGLASGANRRRKPGDPKRETPRLGNGVVRGEHKDQHGDQEQPETEVRGVHRSRPDPHGFSPAAQSRRR
jgi:hypothetical protein